MAGAPIPSEPDSSPSRGSGRLPGRFSALVPRSLGQFAGFYGQFWEKSRPKTWLGFRLGRKTSEPTLYCLLLANQGTMLTWSRHRISSAKQIAKASDSIAKASGSVAMAGSSDAKAVELDAKTSTVGFTLPSVAVG
jgi:hypothetical protein